jgi:hypothetical protein
MEPTTELNLPQVEDGQTKDELVTTAAQKISAILSKELNREISMKDVIKELWCIKYGHMTDDIPLNINVYRVLEQSGISLLYKEVVVKTKTPCYVNNPAGTRRRRF